MQTSSPIIWNIGYGNCSPLENEFIFLPCSQTQTKEVVILNIKNQLPWLPKSAQKVPVGNWVGGILPIIMVD